MKSFRVAAVSLLLCVSSRGAQNHATAAPDSAAVAVPAKIDAAKRADIQHLLDIAGTSALVQQIMDGMEQNLKPLVVKALPPGDYRDRLSELFFEKFRSKFDTKTLIDMAVVRYDENFSDEEIKGLITFYETPLGRKVVTLLPKLTVEMQQDGQRLGQ